MKGIRRFQRTLFTALLGVNVFVFTNTIYHDISLAFWYSGMSVLIAASVLVAISLLRKPNNAKKKAQAIHTSDEN